MLARPHEMVSIYEKRGLRHVVNVALILRVHTADASRRYGDLLMLG